MAKATARAAGAVAGVLRTVGLATVAVLVLHIALTLLQANPANVAAALSNLFLVADPMLSVVLNYGAAALVWLLITVVVVRLVSRVG